MQPPLSSNPQGIIITENRKEEEKEENGNQKIENRKPTSEWPLQCSRLSSRKFLDQPTWNHQHQSDGI